MLAKRFAQRSAGRDFYFGGNTNSVSAPSWGLVIPCLWPLQPQWWVASWRSLPEVLPGWGVLCRVPRWHSLWRRLLCWSCLCGCDCPSVLPRVLLSPCGHKVSTHHVCPSCMGLVRVTLRAQHPLHPPPPPSGLPEWDGPGHPEDSLDLGLWPLWNCCWCKGYWGASL